MMEAIIGWDRTMIDVLFSFRGRLRRLQFVGWWLATIVLGIVAILALIILGVASVKTMSWGLGAGLAAVLAILGIAVLYIWIGLALAAKRIRDIGWSPLLVIGGLILFTIVDMLVLTRLLGVFPNKYGNQTAIGFLVNLAYMGVLLFWPSASDGDESEPAEPLREAPVVAAAPRPVMRQVGGPRREFGLRTR